MEASVPDGSDLFQVGRVTRHANQDSSRMVLRSVQGLHLTGRLIVMPEKMVKCVQGGQWINPFELGDLQVSRHWQQA